MSNIDLVKEIIDHCEKEQNFSYYELEAYIYDNKLDWLIALKDRKSRSVISTYLKSRNRQLRKAGVKVPKLAESVEKILERRNQINNGE